VASPPSTMMIWTSPAPLARRNAAAVHRHFRFPSPFGHFPPNAKHKPRRSATGGSEPLPRRFEMPLSYMEHFLLQTDDIEATKEWYVNVLGFRVGPSPDFKFPVYWLYLGDRDVLHITTGGKNVSENRKKYVGQQSEATTGTGMIDHIGFRTTGLLQMIDHLKKNNIDFNERQVDDQGLYQLFLFDPNGVKIELNFANSEAKGRKPELMASNLTAATN
jgi:catechol 2,3-dioxygenase-like lactoylglutathione lyase family enzyme